jgi:FkbM family methyltransferase
MTLPSIVQKFYLMLSRHLRRTPLRRVRWVTNVHDQLFRRLFRSNIVRVGDFTLEVDRRDRNIAKKLALYGEYERYYQTVLMHHAKLGSTVIDVGANIGLHTIPLARKVGSAGRVIAIEPDPENFLLLIRNTQRNGVNNVTAYPVALSSKPASGLLYQSDTNRGGLSLCEQNVEDPTFARKAVEVEVVVGDSLLGNVTPNISLIKIDVEGAEPLVLEGMEKVLDRNPHTVLAFEFSPRYVVNFQQDPLEFLLKLERNGFGLTVIDEQEQRLVDGDANSILHLGVNSEGVLNILAIPTSVTSRRK